MNIHLIAWPKVGVFVQAAITLLIAVIAVLIQFQQAETNRRQYRLALFEKRVKVFDATAHFISDVLRDAKLDMDRLFQFWRDARDHELLFGPEIKEYLNKLYSKGAELHALGMVALEQRNHQRVTEVLEWFSTQLPEATQKFLEYIDFRKP